MVMHYRKIFGFTAALTFLITCRVHASETQKTLRLEIPKSLVDCKPFLLVAQFGSFGGSADFPKYDPDLNQYCGKIKDGATIVKAMVVIPGYTVASIKMKPEEVTDKPIALQFSKLPIVPVIIKLTTSGGDPISGETVSLKRSFPYASFLNPDDNPFRGYDGPAYDYTAEPVATGITDSSGMATLRVPQILDDPINKSTGQSAYNNACYYVMVGSRSFESIIEPYAITAQKSYPEVQIIKIIHRCSLAGKVKQSFLDKNGITEPMGQVDGPEGRKVSHIYVFAQKTDGSGSSVAVKADGSYTINGLFPGKYEIRLQVQDDNHKTIKTVVFKEDIEIGEDETENIVLE